MTKPKPSTFIIAAVPAYNEDQSIGIVVSEVRPYVSEVFVYDDSSEDNTVSVAKAAGATVFSHPSRKGYGADTLLLEFNYDGDCSCNFIKDRWRNFT